MTQLSDILSSDDLRQVSGLQMLARGVVEGFVAGLHRSPHRGNSVEFKQHRPYVPGDDLRTLDWKIYGKTDRFYVREFEEETNLRATLLLDCSGSMGYGTDGITKHDYALRLAACLSYLMLRQQDGVGLVTFDTQVHEFVPPRSSPRHLTALLDRMTRCSTGGDTDLGRVFHELAPKLHRRGLVILLSDCFGDVADLMRGLAHFRHARHDVIIFQIWHRDELDFPFKGQMRFDSLEKMGLRRQIDAPLLRRQYLARLADFRETLRDGCARHRIDLVPLVTDQPYAVALREYLARRLRGATYTAAPASPSNGPSNGGEAGG